MVRKKWYLDRESGIKSFDLQPFKLKHLSVKSKEFFGENRTPGGRILARGTAIFTSTEYEKYGVRRVRKFVWASLVPRLIILVFELLYWPEISDSIKILNISLEKLIHWNELFSPENSFVSIFSLILMVPYIFKNTIHFFFCLKF